MRINTLMCTELYGWSLKLTTFNCFLKDRALLVFRTTEVLKFSQRIWARSLLYTFLIRSGKILMRLNIIQSQDKPEYYHRTSDNARQKIQLCPMKAASQQTQLLGVKLIFFYKLSIS